VGTKPRLVDGTLKHYYSLEERVQTALPIQNPGNGLIPSRPVTSSLKVRNPINPCPGVSGGRSVLIVLAKLGPKISGNPKSYRLPLEAPDDSPTCCTPSLDTCFWDDLVHTGRVPPVGPASAKTIAASRPGWIMKPFT
jgi:hypothetical protein